MFRNRLEKVYRHKGKIARKSGVTCYRVYDHDLPEFPLMLEWYGTDLYVAEYRRRHGMEEEAHDAWLESCLEVVAEVLQVPRERMFVRMRQRKAGRTGQYQKLEVAGAERVVEEAGLKFIVNLSDYLDTGLFLDHRLTRSMVREESAGKNVLNLFAYTGSFSVYAVAGSARSVDTVDLSNTYTAWTERNMALNFPEYRGHRAFAADALRWMAEAPSGRYDLIVLDPPTFSNSKRMKDFLDIQRDHPAMINECLRLLTPGGVLYFSTNFTRFVLDTPALHPCQVRDITRATTPFDFEGKLKRPCFRIVKG